MNTTKLITVLCAVFFLSLALVSAIDFYQPVTSGTEVVSIINATATASTISLEGSTTITPTVSVVNDILSVNLLNINYAALKLSKVYSGNIILLNTTDNSINTTIPVTIQRSYCSNGTSTNSTKYLEITSIKDLTSSTKWKWKPADDVEIQVKIRYNNNDDSDDNIDGVVKLELYDLRSATAVDMDNSDDLERSISLDEGTTQTEVFTLNVPADLDDGSGNYALYFKVYEDGRESSLCADKTTDSDYSQEITVDKESYEVILKDMDITTPTICGGQVSISGTAWNIGTNDEDKVYFQAFNNELGVRINSSSFSLDQGDSKKVTFDFLVPMNATEKTYDILLTAFYKYSKSSGEFRELTEDPYRLALKIEGCAVLTKNASIAVAFSPETPKAIIGQQVILEATVKNLGSSAVNYTIDLSGNSAWSTYTVDPKTVSLTAGESKKVLLYLDVNPSATEGDKDFVITATSDSFVTSQAVRITLENGLTTERIINHLRNNWVVYTIILVNLILIIAIILVVRSIVKK